MAGLYEDGHMNEGITNIQLGLAGNPPMAEHIAIKRDLELCRYTGAKIHFSKVTTALSIKLLEAAKQEGLPVTCDTGVHYLCYNEQHLQDYPTNLKLDPPLRTPEDQKALISGLSNGVIDALIADHKPVEWEAKACEFPLAVPGAIGLQTTLPLLMESLNWEDFINAAIPALTANPRHLLDLEPVKVEEEYPAHLTVFNPSGQWVLDENTNQSRSTNTVCYGQTLKGMLTGVFTGGQLHEAPQALAAKA
jgi:dihydroorotase